MVIALREKPERKYVVYGIYWGKADVKNQGLSEQRLHYVIEPDDGVDGFSPLAEDEIIVLDNSLDNYTLVKEAPGIGDMLVHNAALPVNDLFDYLSENGHPEKVKQLFQNMRDMGLEPYDI